MLTQALLDSLDRHTSQYLKTMYRFLSGLTVTIQVPKYIIGSSQAALFPLDKLQLDTLRPSPLVIQSIIQFVATTF